MNTKKSELHEHLKKRCHKSRRNCGKSLIEMNGSNFGSFFANIPKAFLHLSITVYIHIIYSIQHFIGKYILTTRCIADRTNKKKMLVVLFAVDKFEAFLQGRQLSWVEDVQRIER